MNLAPAVTLGDLDAGIAYRLTLLITSEQTALAILLQRWRAHVAWPVKMMVLTSAHNRPSRFRAELVRCLAPLVCLRSDHLYELSLEEAVVALLNGLTGLSEPLILVFQGYDVICSPDIHDAVSIMLDYLPPRMHVYITASREPPLTCVPRLRVRWQLLELGSSSSRLSIA